MHPGPGGKELSLRATKRSSHGVVLAAALVVASLGVGTPRLLLEEAENGLHPRQLKVVADTIRLIAQTRTRRSS